MRGDVLFLVGAAIEMVGLHQGTHAWAVGVSMIAYGIMVLVTGYL